MHRLFLSFAVGFLGCLAIPCNLNAQDEEEYINRGKAWADKGEYDNAIDAYTEAMFLNPEYASAYSGRGYVWQMKGEYEKALADFNELVRLRPDDAKPYTQRGVVWTTSASLKRPLPTTTKQYDLTPQMLPRMVSVVLHGHKKASTTRPSRTSAKP